MIVLDASAIVELLTRGRFCGAIRRQLVESDDHVIVPHLVDVEVLSALRGLAAGRKLDAHDIEQYLDGLASLPAERYAHLPLTRRIWELRRNFTAYDATYIALAEETDSILFTCDEKLRRGHRARVMLFTQ